MVACPPQTHAATRQVQLVRRWRTRWNQSSPPWASCVLILSFTPRSGDPTARASQSEGSFFCFLSGLLSTHLACSLARWALLDWTEEELLQQYAPQWSEHPHPPGPLCAATEKNIFARARRHLLHFFFLGSPPKKVLLRHFFFLFPCANFVLYSSSGQLVSPFPFPCFTTTQNAYFPYSRRIGPVFAQGAIHSSLRRTVTTKLRLSFLRSFSLQEH